MELAHCAGTHSLGKIDHDDKQGHFKGTDVYPPEVAASSLITHPAHHMRGRWRPASACTATALV